MSVWKYVKDRAVLLFMWLLSFILSLVVFYLDIGTGQPFIRSSSILYAFVLGFIVFSLGLILDYMRQRAWFKEVNNALSSVPESDISLCLQHPATREQLIMQELLARQYGRYMSELLLMRQQREQHMHFANQWVHHMKTPVSVLNLMTQLQAKPMNVQEAEHLLQSVGEETERLARGLEMMLNTARLEKFELDLRVDQVSLHHVIRQVTNQHKKSFIRYQLFPKIVGDDVKVESDEKWLQFVLTQLVTNAIKYSRGKEGASSLQFEIVKTEDAVRLEVRDEGIGIAEHDLPRIFDAFFTGENGRLEGDATGMGLYLVKQVCSRLGHKITVKSELGKGTVFTLQFQSDSIHRGYNMTTDLSFLKS